jgi:hypothetical protein
VNLTRVVILSCTCFLFFSLTQRPSGSSKASYRFRSISDRFRTIEDVQAGLREVGLESSNCKPFSFLSVTCSVIIGVDFTKSNTWTGKRTFGGKSLHHVSPHELNPYQQGEAFMFLVLPSQPSESLVGLWKTLTMTNSFLFMGLEMSVLEVGMTLGGLWVWWFGRGGVTKAGRYRRIPLQS